MSYLHIPNLYKDQKILMFKECYALEKIHGTSAHISYKEQKVAFFSGGGSYDIFVKLFDVTSLKYMFDNLFPDKHVYVYGEFYGGKLQGMIDTYGDTMRFVAFEVKVGEMWLNVPDAEKVCKQLGLDFVYYTKIPTTLNAIDAERDADSIQAIKNGVGEGHKREGIVLRPLTEVTLNNGDRVIVKHKNPAFGETKTPRKVVDPSRLEVLAGAVEVANEWVTLERLKHVLDGVEPKIENTSKVISLMIEDIVREAYGEIIDSSEAHRQIGRATAILFKRYLNGR